MAKCHPGCIALGNIIIIHLIILVICILSWINLGIITTNVQVYSMGFITMVWFVICATFVLWNVFILLLDWIDCPICDGLRKVTAQYGCLYLAYSKKKGISIDLEDEYSTSVIEDVRSSVKEIKFNRNGYDANSYNNNNKYSNNDIMMMDQSEKNLSFSEENVINNKSQSVSVQSSRNETSYNDGINIQEMANHPSGTQIMSRSHFSHAPSRNVSQMSYSFTHFSGQSGYRSYSKYYRYVLVTLLLAAEGALIVWPFFSFSDLEANLNNGIIPAVFSPDIFDKINTNGINSIIQNEDRNFTLIPDSFNFVNYLIPGSFALTGGYNNRLFTTASTGIYKEDCSACKMDVIRPTDRETPDLSKPSPVIFHVHGGGYKSGDKTNPNTAIGFWLDRGYAFVSISYQLNVDILTMLDDVERAWLFIAENANEWNLDSTNVIFLGDEAGGHLATTVAYRTKDERIRGVINMYGMTEWLYYFEQGGSKLKMQYFDQLTGPLDLDTLKIVYGEVSPSTHVTPNTPPTLTIHGEDDTIVPIDMNKHLHDVLRQNGVKNLLLSVPFAGTNLDFGWNSKGGQITAFAMDQFFAIHFK